MFYPRSEEIHVLQDYTRSLTDLRQAIDGIATWQSKDNSTNLYGAYIKGLAHLRARMLPARGKFTQGMLFLLTDGTDQAARKSLGDALRYRQAVGSNFQVVTIGVGGEVDRGVLNRIADVYVPFRGWKEFDQARVAALAKRLDELGRSFHVLSYCSPKRNGQHSVQIEVDRRVLGPGGRSNRIERAFDGAGFQGGCDADAAVLQLAECGVPGKTCAAGYACAKEEYRCVSLAEREQEKRRRAAQRLALEQEQERRQRAMDVAHRGCIRGNDALREEWTRYRPHYQRYLQSDCGLRLRSERRSEISSTR